MSEQATAKVPSDVEIAESWHKVHAQLLKSVADAQAKLLAAQNETNDRLERMDRDLRVLIAQTQEAVRNSHHDLQAGVMDLLGRLDERQSLTPHARPKRIVKRA